jgi:hypothetical protein
MGEYHNYDKTKRTELIEIQTLVQSQQQNGVNLLVDMGWQFLIETWFHQNKKDHDEKQIVKIMWIKSQIKNITAHYKHLTIETMMTYPVNNHILLSENITANQNKK